MAKRQDASTGQIVDDGQSTKKSEGPMHVKVYSPFNTYYDGEAESISAENDTGPFDVLLGHRNFLTLLNPCDIIVRRSGQEEEKISITRGLMHVRQDKVVVFLDV
jgi:F0F1-type ATP synthase epsilon subunit